MDTSPGAEADRLQDEAEAIRNNLGALVSELDHRRHDLGRYLKPAALGAAIVGLAAVAAVVGRRFYKRPSRLDRLWAALQRLAAHPERLASARR